MSNVNSKRSQSKKVLKVEAQNSPRGGSSVKKIEKGNIKTQKFEDLEGKFLLVRVGTELNPATDVQIEEIQKKLIELFDKNGVNCLTFVTHHAVDVSLVEKQGV